MSELEWRMTCSVPDADESDRIRNAAVRHAALWWT